MMALKINWKKIARMRQILKDRDYPSDADVTITLVTKKHSIHKKTVKVSELMTSLWEMDSPPANKEIIGFAITDSNHNILFKHRKYSGNEEIPSSISGHGEVLKNWNNLTTEQKNIYLEIAISFIQSYAK
jgi:hypothetical protein